MKRSVAVTTLGLVCGFGLLACSSSGSDDATPAAGTAPVTSPTAPTIAATPTPAPVLTPGVGGAPATLVLDGTPKTIEAGQKKALVPFVASTLPAADRMDTVLYDVAANTQLNLGPGTIGQFSADGKYMAWSTLAGNNATEVWVLDLATRQRRPLGAGRDPQFLDPTHLVIFTGGQTRVSVDVTNGTRADFPANQPVVDFSTDTLAGGTYRMKATILDQSTYMRSRYLIEELAGNKAVFQFDALAAEPAGPDEVVVATVPVNGMTNIYTVSARSGASKFVATTRFTRSPQALAATTDFVAWTEAFCDFTNPGNTKIYDRKANTITELNDGFWVSLAPDGKLAPGEFGGKSLIDPATLRLVFAVPGASDYDRGPETRWSPDYKFASTGFVGGHGGLCG